jgi:hypothetical protein
MAWSDDVAYDLRLRTESVATWENGFSHNSVEDMHQGKRLVSHFNNVNVVPRTLCLIGHQCRSI